MLEYGVTHTRTPTFSPRKNSTDVYIHGCCSQLVGIIFILTVPLLIREKVISVYLSVRSVSSDAT